MTDCVPTPQTPLRADDPLKTLLEGWRHNEARVEAAEAFRKRLKPPGKRLILTVDGGGSRGLITLHCLAKLEELTLRPAYDLFDMVAGTSTGAIIAAGLIMQRSAHDLIRIYGQQIPNVFTDEHKKLKWAILAELVGGVAGLSVDLQEEAALVASTGGRWIYPNRGLFDIANELLRDPDTGRHLTFGEIYDRSKAQSGGGHTRRVLITIKDVVRSQTLFAVNAGPGAAAWRDVPLIDAVMGSSVAPVYLEPYVNWVDGGVGTAQNPCYHTAVEAIEYFTGLRGDYEPRDDDACYAPHNTIMLSFGTGVASNRKKPDQIERTNILEWLSYVAGEGLDDALSDQTEFTRDRYVRSYPWHAKTRIERGWYFEPLDFRRFNVALDAAQLSRPISEGGLGMRFSAAEGKLLNSLDLAARSPEELDLMARIGAAWADALANTASFVLPQPPYPGAPKVMPPGSPQPGQPLREYLPELLKAIRARYPLD